MADSYSLSPLAGSSRKPQRVTFNLDPHITVIKNITGKRHFPMASQFYQTLTAENVTGDMLAEAARLFNENYGVWGPQSHRPGNRVKLSARKLREQYLLAPTRQSESLYIRVTIDGKLVGNAFACRWNCKTQTVCWVTQLVVDQHHRGKGLASGLLRTLRQDSDDIYGVMSSHPAACLAATKAFGRTIEKVDLNFIGKNAKEVMLTSPIPYIRDAKLCGTLFDADDTSGIISGVNTNFFVDHTEPLEALAVVEAEWQWPLGKLPDGHEYLLILPAKQRRSRSRSVGVHR